MPKAIVTGSGGLIGSESAARLVEAGYDVIGIENDTRAVLFGPEASTAHVTERLNRELDSFRTVDLDIRDAEGIDRVFAEARQGDRAGRPHRGAALARLGGERPAGRLRHQRQRHAQPARGDPPALPRGDLHLHLDQQGLRRHAQPPAAGRAGDAARAARRPRVVRRHRHDDVDRLDPALALRRLEGGGRPAGPGVRPLLRHAHGLLPRRLPHRPQPRRRPAARLPRLPDEVHGHRRPLHRLRLRGQAGARQRAQRRPGRRLPALPREAPARRPSTTSAAAARTPARCWRRSRSASGSPGASCAGR